MGVGIGEQITVPLLDRSDRQVCSVISQQLIRGPVKGCAIGGEILKITAPSRPTATVQSLFKGRLERKRRNPGRHNEVLRESGLSLPDRRYRVDCLAMVKLICRIPQDELPTAEEASAAGVSAWLIGARMNFDGKLQIQAPEAWLHRPERSLPFCLEWQLPQALTPREERYTAGLLAPWLAQPSYLRWHGLTPLWIADPECLSHVRLVAQRLRLQLGPSLSLFGGGPQGSALDACYERPLRDIPCLAVNARQRHYGSFLHHAHHLGQHAAMTALIPAVLAPGAGAEVEMFTGATADSYREWLELAMAWAALWHQPADDGLVLIESWEGHCSLWPLPSASLSSSRPSPPPPARQTQTMAWGEMVRANPAVLLHGFHLDLLGQTLQELQGDRSPPIDLYVSTPLDQLEATAALVRDIGWCRAEIVGVENRGRDIAPFLLELLPRVIANDHPWLLKLHTKRSIHLNEGDRWGQHLRRTLTKAAMCCEIDDWFARESDLGLIAPPGSMQPCTISLNRNAAHLQALLPRLALRGAWFLQQSFVAGSMFAVRCQALTPFVRLNLSIDDFEPELSQRDGTLAHAFERLLAPVVTQAGLQVRELSGNRDCTPRFGHGWAAPLR